MADPRDALRDWLGVTDLELAHANAGAAFTAQLAALSARVDALEGAVNAPAPDPTPPPIGSYLTHPRSKPATDGHVWVDPNATSDGDGTSARPFRALEEALTVVQDGQRVISRGGVVRLSGGLRRTTRWARGIEVVAYGSERVTLDCGSIGTARALSLAGAREHWRGFDISGGDGGAVLLTGEQYKLEDINAFDMARAGSGGGVIYQYATGDRGNLWQDVRVWRIGDGRSTSTNAPDAFKVHADSVAAAGALTMVRCIGANAPDDAFDLYYGRGATLIDLVAFQAGWYANGARAADGGGFKLGTSGTGGHTVTGCLAIECANDGFNENGSTIPNSLEACTSVGNTDYGFQFSTADAVARALVSFGNGGSRNAGHYNQRTTRMSGNSWDETAGVAFVNPAAFDYRLTDGRAIGASAVALQLAREWLPRMTA